MKNGNSRQILITGGAGFIGSNLAERLLQHPNTRVRIFDNLSRSGVLRNVEWLQSLPGSSRLDIVEGDIRDENAVRKAVRGISEIYHLAAQVAVTTSIDDPSNDFRVNALGTLNLLEGARHSGLYPFFFYTSTNKVYGSLQSVPVHIDGTRYRAKDPSFRGVTEAAPLDFHSPYGCSKGSADQYVRDYARIYKLPTVVFRMSCIAGPRQFGNEDQGWVAHFVYSVLSGTPITIYGDGFQVRDVLHVHDLLDAMDAVRRKIDRTGGQVYNLGGGMTRAFSIVEMLRAIQKYTGHLPHIIHSAVRPGDQPLYVSNTRKLQLDTNWKASRSIVRTLESICDFWHRNSSSITPIHRASTVPIFTEEVA